MKKISVILATNSDKAYQYLVPADFNIKKGMIVKAPFRSRELFGIIWDDSDEKMEKSKVYAIVVIEDDKPIGLLRMHDVLRSGIK